MANNELNPAVVEFVRTNIYSVSQLEVLLLLWRNSQQEWTASEVSRKMYTNESAALDLLEALAARDLLMIRRADNATTTYIFNNSAVMDDEMREVDEAYLNKRLRVVDLIFSASRSSD